MSKRKMYRVVRLLGLLSVALMLLLAGCSLGDYPALLQGCTLFTGQIGAPNVPTGPSSGDVDVSYTFATSAVDPQGGDVSIQFDWGDGAISVWSDYVASGTSVSMSHSYSNAGTFQVKARAKDRMNRESVWSGAHAITIGGGGASEGQEGTVKWQWTADAGVTGIGYTSAVGCGRHHLRRVWIADQAFRYQLCGIFVVEHSGVGLLPLQRKRTGHELSRDICGRHYLCGGLLQALCL